jgi:uncharacterized protein
MMRALALLAALAMVSCAPASAPPAPPPEPGDDSTFGDAAGARPASPPLPAGDRVRIVHGRDTFLVAVELAETERQISTGLMEREQLAADAGMLFLFREAQSGRRGFWMYRTRIPLDVAFLDAEWTIVAIREMEPCSSPIARFCRTYAPGVPYQAALEVNRGYFAGRGIGLGARVVLERAPQNGL